MSLARPLLPILAAALLIAGCGSTDEPAPTATATTPAALPGASVQVCEGAVAGTKELRVTGIDCNAGRGVAAAWASERSCSPEGEASRASCAVHRGYRCLGAAVERGIAVSCARSGSSVAFIARRG